MIGLDADFVVWDPFKKVKVSGKDLPLKENKAFIWLNRNIYGEVRETFLRGDLVFRRNQKPPHFYYRKGDVLARK